MADRITAAVMAHNSLLELPAVTRASLIGNVATLELTSKNVKDLKKCTIVKSISLPSETNVSVEHSRAVIQSVDVMYQLDTNTGRTIIFTRVDKKKITIQIYQTINLTKLDEICIDDDQHGDIYLDDTFGPPVLHPDGHSILYVAEAASSKADKFNYSPDFGETFTGKSSPTLFLLLMPDSPYCLGEGGIELHQMTEGHDGIFFGQARFLPAASQESRERQIPRIVATGYSETGDGRKMGLVYCTNRLSAIYELNLAEPQEKIESDETKNGKWIVDSHQRLSPSSLSARSPRVVPSGVPQDGWVRPDIVYIANRVERTHNSCSSLHSLTPLSRDGHHIGYKNSELVAVVDEPKDADGSFQGLFVDQLPASPFLEIGSEPCIALTTQDRSRQVVQVVNLLTRSLTTLAPWRSKSKDPVFPYLHSGASEETDEMKDGMRSYSVLATDGGIRLIINRSALNELPVTFMCDLSRQKRADKWTVLHKPMPDLNISDRLASISFTVIPLPKFSPTEIIIVSPIEISPSSPARINLPPLLTIAHGGPHSSFNTAFSIQVAAYVLAGYRVALVNYPGSTGYGQANIDVLPPKLGELDVDATVAAGHYLNTLSLSSGTKGKRLYSGGSHGGFIGSWISVKYPDAFSAMVLRNPVVDLVAMSSSTDIPDWTYAETTLPYPFSAPPTHLTPEAFTTLYNASPIRLSHLARVPTLLLIGKDDRRVPPDQGRSWFHALKSNHIIRGSTAEEAKVEEESEEGGKDRAAGEVKMMAFEGNGHALTSTIEAEVVGFENGLRFLAKYTDF